jgi:uncharacterized protein YecT (DUF1311 family)
VKSVVARERSASGRDRRVISRRRLSGAAAVAFAVAGLVAISPAAGAPTRYGGGDGKRAAGPPVIIENFKPVLACNPDTTVGMEGCGEHRVIAADTQLDADVKVIFDLLRGGAARRDFVSAQTAWLAYRNADCRSQSDAYLGGSEQPVVYVDCLAGDDSARRNDVKGFFALLTQGLAQVPKYP